MTSLNTRFSSGNCVHIKSKCQCFFHNVFILLCVEYYCQDMDEPISKLKLKIVLRDYLEANGVTVYLLTKWVQGISPQTLYAIANGTRRPSLEALEIILQALHEHSLPAALSDIVVNETTES